MLGVNVRERLELLADGALHRVALEKVAVDPLHLVAMRHGARRALAARSVHEHGGGSDLQPLLPAGGGGGSKSRGRCGAARCGTAWCAARYAGRRLRPRKPGYTARRARLPTGGGGGRGRTTKSSDSVTRLWRALRTALSEVACARRVGLGRRGAVGGNVHLVGLQPRPSVTDGMLRPAPLGAGETRCEHAVQTTGEDERWLWRWLRA
eukprot:scaffold58867_cov65-Phaeocystis_antarctica.AAC.10